MLTKEIIGELLIFLEIPLCVRKLEETKDEGIYAITIVTEHPLLKMELLLKLNTIKEYFRKKNINPNVSVHEDSLRGTTIKIDGLIYLKNAK